MVHATTLMMRRDRCKAGGERLLSVTDVFCVLSIVVAHCVLFGCLERPVVLRPDNWPDKPETRRQSGEVVSDTVDRRGYSDESSPDDLWTCEGNACAELVCRRECGGKMCGSDGCGGSCGSCDVPSFRCNSETGHCEESECIDSSDTPWDGCHEGKIVEFQVNQHSDGDQKEPAASSLDAGYVIVWQGDNPDKTPGTDKQQEIYARIFDEDGKGGKEFQVNTIEEGVQSLPFVAAIGKQIVFAWKNESGFLAAELMYRVFDGENPQMGTEKQIEAGMGTQSPSEFAIARSGCELQYYMLWQQSAPGLSFDVKGLLLTLTGSVVPQTTPSPFYVVGPFEGAQQRPSVASDAAGGYLVAWDGPEASVDKEAGGAGIYMLYYDSEGTPQCPVGDSCSGTKVNASSKGEQRRPSVAFDKNDESAIAWLSSTGGYADSGVFMQRFDNSGKKKGGELHVMPGNAEEFERLTLAPTNNATDFPGFGLVWLRDGKEIEGKIYGVDDDDGSSFELKSLTSLDGVEALDAPSLTSLTNGSLLVLWQSMGQDGDGWGVFAHRYEVESGHLVSVRTPLAE
jgi:hypothetical protein